MELGGKNFDTPVNKGDVYNRYTAPVQDIGYVYSLVSWTQAEMDAWPEVDVGADQDNPERLQTYSYQNVPIEKNYDHSVWEPQVRDFFRTEFWTTAIKNPWFTRYTVNDYLMHPEYCVREGVFASNEKDHTIVSFEYEDLNSKEKTMQTQMWPAGDLGSLVGGDRFNKGGPV
jgi:hypothetical protein